MIRLRPSRPETRLDEARRPRLAALLLTASCALTGCTTQDESPQMDASADTFVSATLRDSPAVPEATLIGCGDTPCPEPPVTPLEALACCDVDGGCGLTTGFLGGVCTPPNRPGGVDSTCPALQLPGGPTLQGCCTPAGTCGAFDRFGDLGCIPGEDYGRAPIDCAYDARNDCTQIVEVRCDGPEDCDDRQQCCGRRQLDSYDAFGCFSRCDSITDGDVGIWLAVSVETDASVADSSGVRCGDDHCGEDQKCCVRPPHSPYCAPASDVCSCRLVSPEAGASDGSSDR